MSIQRDLDTKHWYMEIPGEPVELLPIEVELAQLRHGLEPQPLVLNIFIHLHLLLSTEN